MEQEGGGRQWSPPSLPRLRAAAEGTGGKRVALPAAPRPPRPRAAEAKAAGAASLPAPRRREAERGRGPGGVLRSGPRRGSMEKRGPVLHIVVVGFHHKKGCQVRGAGAAPPVGGCPSSPASPLPSLPSPALSRRLPGCCPQSAAGRPRGEGWSSCGRELGWRGRRGGFALAPGAGEGAV